MKWCRIFRACVLGGLLLLTAQITVASQLRVDKAGQMVICTGIGPVTVYVDDEGQPTGPPHICPDCLQALLGHLPTQTPEAARRVESAPLRWLDSAVLQASRQIPTPPARGPPVFVI